ncbi:hypothetical protein PQR71_07110 [Paraburkholderia fungorum]|uniref:hypothetical protein n=1 Tax=Paraburkholderia fungorum TaxID=134537 RepID=UPI0038BA8869
MNRPNDSRSWGNTLPHELDVTSGGYATSDFENLVDCWYAWCKSATSQFRTQSDYPAQYIATHLSNLPKNASPSAFFQSALNTIPLSDIEGVDAILSHHSPGPCLIERALGAAIARYILLDASSASDRDVAWSIVCHLQSAPEGFHLAFVRECGPERHHELVEWARFYGTDIEKLLRPFQLELALETIDRWRSDDKLLAAWNRRALSHFHIHAHRVAWIGSVLAVSAETYLECLEALENPALIATMLAYPNVQREPSTILNLLGIAANTRKEESTGAATWRRTLAAPLLLESAVERTDIGSPRRLVPGNEGDMFTDESALDYASDLAAVVAQREDADFLLGNWLTYQASEFAFARTRDLNPYTERRLLVSDVLFNAMSDRDLSWTAWAKLFGILPKESASLDEVAESLRPHRTNAMYTAWCRIQEHRRTPLAIVDDSAHYVARSMLPSPSHLPDANWQDWRLVYTVLRAPDPAAFWRKHWIALEPTRVKARHNAEYQMHSSQLGSLYWAWIGYLALNLPQPEQQTSYLEKLLAEVCQHALTGYLEFGHGFRYQMDGSLWANLVVHLALISFHMERSCSSEGGARTTTIVSQIKSFGGDTLVHAHVAVRARQMGISVAYLLEKWNAAGQNLAALLQEHLETAQLQNSKGSTLWLVSECTELLHQLRL